MDETTFYLPEGEYDDDEILEWKTRDFPQQLLNCLYRFTRIPNSDSILPIIAAYELMPLLGLPVCSGLFCYGSSGSGKSSLGKMLQVMNPRYDGSTKPLSALDSPTGWLASLKEFRWLNASGTVNPTSLLVIDDLTSKSLLGDIGNQRLQLLKQLNDRSGCITKGAADGSTQTFHTFTKFVFSSITDLGGIEGLSELNRRVILVKHKPITEWAENEYSDRNRGIHLDNYRDFTGWTDYPATKLLWLNQHREEIVKDRTALRRYCKANRDTYPIPEVLIDFYNPIISMGMTAELWAMDEGISLFQNLLERNTRKGNDSHLLTILKQWLDLDEGYGKMLKRFGRLNVGFEVEYSRVMTFLKTKVQDNELNRHEIQRQAILGAFTDLGYQVTIVNASPVIEMIGETEDD